MLRCLFKCIIERGKRIDILCGCSTLACILTYKGIIIGICIEIKYKDTLRVYKSFRIGHIYQLCVCVYNITR